MQRRDFLAALGGAFAGHAWLEERPLDEDQLYVGTYTETVHVLRMDRRSGALRSVGTLNGGPNPSFLAVHSRLRVLYAVNEVEAGTVRAVKTRAQQSSRGSSPCYVSIDRTDQVLLVANYDSGAVALLPLQPDGTPSSATSVIQHQGRGPVADRQSGPHAHCILADPSNRFALAADLGADRVFVYELDLAAKALRHVDGGDAVMRSGAGPRHLAFHPRLPLVYVTNELDSTVGTLRFDASRGALEPVDTRSTLPAGWSGTNYPADIHVAPSGNTAYVSNRGHNSIAVFAVSATGALALVQTVSTQGDWPRNFTLDPSGRWLLVANQRSSSIVVFAREESGTLTATGQRITVPSPVCLTWS
jgi:6-phosphogluconolactonase